MLTPVLLVLVIGCAPPDVSLDDLDRFKVTAAEAQRLWRVHHDFKYFVCEKRLHRIYDSHPLKVYIGLAGALETADTLRSRLASLRDLRRDLGQEAYDAGKIPPPYPAKYQREFERWLEVREKNRKLKIADNIDRQ